MSFTQWKPGTAIASPVYLDASILISGIVQSDRRYKQAAQLFAELLVSKSEIVISALAISEALWGIAKLSYCELYGQKPNAPWNPQIFYRNHQAIFAAYPQRLEEVASLLRDWGQAGVVFSLAPDTMKTLEQTAGAAAVYMKTLRFASADAAHLAMAESKAKSLVTTDGGFVGAVSSSLSIFHVSN